MRTRLRARLAEQERTTERATEELASLKAELRLLREVLDVLPIGVVVRDGEGRERFRNRRGMGPTGDLHADALVAGAVASLLDSSSSVGARETVELHGPPRRSVEVTVQRVGDDALVAVLEDATDRHRVDALRRDFVENVNHELRTPIGALGVLVEAMEGESDPDVVRRLTGRMAGEVQRARALIEDLLQLSSVERAVAPVHVPVDVADVVAAAVARVEAVAEQAGVRVERHPIAPGALPPVLGDADQLVSAVANLLDNAVKYSPSGSTVELTVTAADDDVLSVVVRDHGVGIPAKDLDRVFERFYRVDRARDRRTGGTGLGLAIVRNVAVAHGGDVTVSSVEGEGSTFALRLKQAP